ncbi:MAG: SRPBCC domain-containing protein [bacterium]|nr:SRPBCC domain-containing protein [bacterium]
MSDKELITHRVLAAPPEIVFDVWSDPAHVSMWWGPRGFTTTTHSMDLRPGGEWHFTMHGPDGRDYVNRIEYVEVVPPSRIVYRHRDEGETVPVRFQTTVTFAPLGPAKTLLIMCMVFDTPEHLAEIEEAYGASEGLLETMARLAEHVASANADGARAVGGLCDADAQNDQTPDTKENNGANTMHAVIDIASVFAILRPDLGVDTIRNSPEMYAALDRDYDRFQGHVLIAAYDFTEDWNSWECHPAGDETVILLSGAVEMVLRERGGDRSVVLQEPGTYVIVPRGVWHTAKVSGPARMLFITPGEGTEHAEDPSAPE